MKQCIKIGDFSESFDINQSTVRYYISKGIINPLRKNKRYLFNEKCFEDMKKVQELKGLKFTIKEIKDILENKNKELIFKNKIEQLNSEIKDINIIINKIKQKEFI